MAEKRELDQDCDEPGCVRRATWVLIGWRQGISTRLAVYCVEHIDGHVEKETERELQRARDRRVGMSKPPSARGLRAVPRF